LSNGVNADQKTESDIRIIATMGKGKTMTLLVILIVIGAALVTAAVGQTRRSRKNKGPIQLGVGRK
jgi:hypothetical protein